MVSSRFAIIFVIVFSILYCPDVANTQCSVSKVAETFLDRIFRKYGTAGPNNGTFIKSESLGDLMKSLTLGSIEVVCQSNDTVCLKNKYAGHLPAKRDPLLSRKRRGINVNKNDKEHEIDWKNHLARCMTLQNVTTLFKVNKSGISKADFYNICPSLVQQIDEKVCVHYHKRFPALVEPDGPPDPSEVWGYGFLAITICSLLSLAVIAMIPCLNKSFYNMMMAYLIALAVGTLAGDALLHLIPHAFIEGANLAAEITVSKDQRLRQHYSQVWRAMFVLAGIYMFFIVEQFMKLKGKMCGGSGHGHSHNHEVPMVDATENAIEAGSDDKDDDSAEQEGGHGHSHGANKAITGETKVASVAWMVIVGDGFHNFSDGLAVGAAFSASISSGVSTTIAIFCHELPHELGDFAILLKAGMTIKQAIVYNLVSAVLAYVGLAIGILAGEGELGRHIILSLTAGLFLYISLVDMMGELTDQETVKSRCCTVLCQHLGLLSGIGIMLFISLYEHNM